MRANIVGSGPNGLTAAAILAREGVEVHVYERNPQVGGAAASGHTLGEGITVDLGAAAHPFAFGSPAFNELELTKFGLTWDFHQYPLAHPLENSTSVFLKTGIEKTVNQFPEDATAWRLLHRPIQHRPHSSLRNATSPLIGIPPHPVLMARFGARSLLPASILSSAIFKTREAKALFIGSSAHSMLPLGHLFTSGFGVLFGALGQSWGWPVARGGTGAIISALLHVAQSNNVQIHTNTEVRQLSELPSADITLLDLTPRQVLDIARDTLPSYYQKQLTRWRYGTAAYKVDYLLDGPIPWHDGRTSSSGTVHVGGEAEEIIAAERKVGRGEMPQRPFVMVVQPSSADSSRAPAGQHVVWSYAHVPNGYTGDAGSLIDAQIERFAPGFRDRILRRVETPPAQLEQWNPNLIGGDIGGGSLRGTQQFFRPTVSLVPYRLGVPGLYLCSSSTPPGGGVHGMAGWHAAHRALRDLGIRTKGIKEY